MCVGELVTDDKNDNVYNDDNNDNDDRQFMIT